MLASRDYGLVVDGYVVQSTVRMEEEEGPPPPAPGGGDWRQLPSKPDWGAQPSLLHRLSWVDYGTPPAWVEAATLAELKVHKTEEITRDRIASDSDRFVYQGLSIRTADKDMFDLLVADARISKGGMPPNWPGGWKAIENSYVPISTVEEWNAFFIAMYDTGINNFNRSQRLKARINAATTPEEVAAIHWNMEEA